MDPTGENQIVDTDAKEVAQVEDIKNEIQEEKPQELEQVSNPSSVQNEDEKQVKNEEESGQDKPQAPPSAQPEQETVAVTPEEKDDGHKDKEIPGEKEKEKDTQSRSSKTWKNTRKKKNKDEQIRDYAQWPTLEQARYSRGQSSKKTPTDPSRSPSKSEKSQTRTKRGNINWKPLSDVPKSQGSGEQTSSASGEGEVERGAGVAQGSNQVPSSSGTGRGYAGGYSNRGQPKRRGGTRAPWPRSSPSGTAPQFPQEGANETAANETDAKEDTQVVQNPQDPNATASSSPPHGGQANPGESRRYRGSGRGGPSSRSATGRLGRGNFRPNYFNRYNNAPRGGSQPFTPLRLPQDPEQFNEQIKKQIEYYFGIDNLCRDIYLRKNMNNEGWVPLPLILAFNRVRELNIDVPRLVEALKDSQVVETKDESIRRLDDWARWTFPPRVEGAAQTQAPTQTQENSATNENKDQ